MPRRAIKRINLSGLLSALPAIGAAAGGGDVQAVNPGDVDFEDASFNANTQTRFEPKSGFGNFLTGGAGARAAGALNAQQIISDQQRPIQIQDTIDAENRQLANEKALGDYKNTQALKTGALEETRRNNILGSILANKEALDVNPNLPVEELFDENNVGEFAPEYVKKAQVNSLNYGDLLKTQGLEGAPANIENTKANTAHLNRPEAAKPPNVTPFGKGVINWDKELYIVEETDPMTGKTTLVHKNPYTGEILKKNTPDNPVPAPTTPKKPSTPGVGSGLLSKIKGAGSSVVDTFNELTDDTTGNQAFENLFKREVAPALSQTSQTRAGVGTGRTKAEMLAGGNAGAANKIVELIKKDLVSPSQDTKYQIQILQDSLPEGYLDVAQLYQLLK